MKITLYVYVVVNLLSIALSGRILWSLYPGLKAWAILLALFRAKDCRRHLEMAKLHTQLDVCAIDWQRRKRLL
jgi:hypothetical protein